MRERDQALLEFSTTLGKKVRLKTVFDCFDILLCVTGRVVERHLLQSAVVQLPCLESIA